MKRVSVFFLLSLSALYSAAQELSIDQYSWRLSAIGYDMVECKKEKDRDSCLLVFNETMDSLMSLPSSFQHRFDSVRNIKILNDPKGKFRLLTWGYRHANDSFRFFGILQYAEEGKEFVWLSDSSGVLGNTPTTLTEELGPERWYGALYYTIQEVKYKKEAPYYLLLGWNGNNAKTDIKLIETLSWNEDGEPVFGKPVFRNSEEEGLENRVIFEYGNSGNMALRYEEKGAYISFENVVPKDPKAFGEYQLYLPDGTYDFYKFKKGIWQRGSKY